MAEMTSTGPTFFDNLKRSFEDVKVTEDGVDTGEFLEACDGVVKLFDFVNPTAFAPVVMDISGNIHKIRTKFLSDPINSVTLEKMMVSERKLGKGKRVATEGLLWLLRGLKFTCEAINTCAKDTSLELATAFSNAYNDVLRPFHNFLVRGVVSIALKAAPYRKDFLTKLGNDQHRVETQMLQWGTALEKLVERLQKYMAETKYDQPPF